MKNKESLLGRNLFRERKVTVSRARLCTRLFRNLHKRGAIFIVLFRFARNPAHAARKFTENYVARRFERKKIATVEFHALVVSDTNRRFAAIFWHALEIVLESQIHEAAWQAYKSEFPSSFPCSLKRCCLLLMLLIPYFFPPISSIQSVSSTHEGIKQFSL